MYVESDDAMDTKKIACVGKIYSEHYGIIVDDEGHEVEERTVGELWVRGPSVMKGYWNNDKATKEVLVTRDGQRWLKTGDLAYFAKGELYICGRNKDLLIIRGKNYHPEDIERAAEQIELIRSGQTVAFSIPGDATEEIVIVCETAAPVSEHSSLAQKVKGHINTQVGLKVKHVELQPPRTIPKTTSGKRQRRLVRTIWMKMRGHV